MVLQSSWKEERYIATVTPFISDKVKQGYVYMFKNTRDVEDLIAQLTGISFLLLHCSFYLCL